MDRSAATHDGSLPSFRGVHIAVIDDDLDARDVLAMMLRHCGAVVTVYESAKAALLDIAESLPSIFMCDLAMPGMDGFEFIRRVRALPDDKGRSVPAIAITGFDREFAAPMAKAAGFNAYVIKPMEFDALCQIIQDILPTPPAATQQPA